MHRNAPKTPSSPPSTELADASGRLAAMALAIALNYVGAPPDLPTHEQFRCSEKDYEALCAAIAGAILETSVWCVEGSLAAARAREALAGGLQ